MVTGRLGAILKKQIAPRCQHEHTAELPWVTQHSTGARSFAQRAKGISDQLWGSNLAMSTSKAGRAISMEVRINEQQALDLEFLSEILCEISVPVADDDDFDTERSPRLNRVTQLRNLLTAEESTEVAQEDEDDRSILPQVAEANGLVRNAESEGRRIRLEAEDFAERHLSEAESVLGELYRYITEARAELHKSLPPAEPPPISA